MTAPNTLRVKRKADDDAPDVLILEGSNKRFLAGVRYVRESKYNDAKLPTTTSDEKSTDPDGQKRQELRSDHAGWRSFYLAQATGSSLRLNRKRLDGGEKDDDDVATFLEQKRVKSSEHVETREVDERELFVPAAPPKKPGKGAAIVRPNAVAQHSESGVEQRQLKEFEEWGKEAAREVVQREQEEEFAKQVKAWTKPKQVPAPKLPGQRSRDIHRRRVVSNGVPSTTDTFKNLSQEVDMDDKADYVYERYVLAPSTDEAASQAHTLLDKGNVGYLVITEDDESLWNSYLEDESSDEGEDSADADSNAEDFYAAEYPEDELASDDEFDRGAYGYRGVIAEDDEEWDQDTGAFSDEEEDGLEGMRKRFERLTAQAQTGNFSET